MLSGRIRDGQTVVIDLDDKGATIFQHSERKLLAAAD